MSSGDPRNSDEGETHDGASAFTFRALPHQETDASGPMQEPVVDGEASAALADPEMDPSGSVQEPVVGGDASAALASTEVDTGGSLSTAAAADKNQKLGGRLVPLLLVRTPHSQAQRQVVSVKSLCAYANGLCANKKLTPSAVARGDETGNLWWPVWGQGAGGVIMGKLEHIAGT